MYRGTAPGNLQFLATAGGPAFTDTGLPEGAVRYYAVSAQNPVGEGGRTGTINQVAPTRPGAPLATAAQGGPGFGQVTLAWQAPADLGGIALQGYRVYRLGPGGAWGELASLGPSGASYTDPNPPLLSMSHYRVAAFNAVGEGPAGSAVCVAPQPWGAVDAPLGEPCPVPGGWQERALLSLTIPLADVGAGPVDQDVATLDAGRRPGNPGLYDVDLTVLGQPLPRISVFDNGAMQSDLSFALVHLPRVLVPLPDAVVEVELAERHDPLRQTCYLGLGELCPVNAPNVLPATWIGEAGPDAVLVLRLRVRNAGGVVAEQVVALPFGGLAASVVPAPDLAEPGPPPGLPPVPIVPGGPSVPGLPPLPRPVICLDQDDPSTCLRPQVPL